jgi:hypothetical protein
MKKRRRFVILAVLILTHIIFQGVAAAWYDETHIAIAKAAGYKKWYNAAGADMAKVKAGKSESLNHFTSNPPGRIITPEMVLKQAGKYDRLGFSGHLYGAIIGSLRKYIEVAGEGKYAEYHMAFCAHYVGDLSQPLHNTDYNLYNEKYHSRTDGVINNEVLDHPEKIKIYPIILDSEKDLAVHIARIAALSLRKGARLEKENRLISGVEAYEQISHSASLFKAILEYAKTKTAEQSN